MGNSKNKMNMNLRTDQKKMNQSDIMNESD
jgi:hypothetical protein